MTQLVKLIFVICFILTCPVFAMAEDVALVTELFGTATASWQDPAAAEDKAGKEEGRYDWQLEVAEMLPAGAEISTGEESSLTIIHLVSNIEYHLGSGSRARLSDLAIEGDAVVSEEEVRLVSTDISLEESMQNQVGAVVADHLHLDINRSPSPSQSNSISVLSELDDQFGNQSFRTVLSSADQKKADTEDTPGGTVLKRGREQSLPKPAIFALPIEMVEAMSSKSERLHVKDCQLDIATNHEGWVEFSMAAPELDQDFAFKLVGDKGTRRLVLHVESSTQPSAHLAWRLEKSGLLAQAAAVWLELQNQGVEATKVTPHLERIKARLLARQK